MQQYLNTWLIYPLKNWFNFVSYKKNGQCRYKYLVGWNKFKCEQNTLIQPKSSLKLKPLIKILEILTTYLLCVVNVVKYINSVPLHVDLFTVRDVIQELLKKHEKAVIGCPLLNIHQ